MWRAGGAGGQRQRQRQQRLEKVPTAHLPRRMETCQETWIRDEEAGYTLTASIAVDANKVSARVVIPREHGGQGLVAIDVDVNGQHHSVPITSCGRTIYNQNTIRALFIRFFSPAVFVVFAQIDNASWPFGCFLQLPDGAFACNVCYSTDAVADIAVIGNRFLVIDEVIICQRCLWVTCFDMQNTQAFAWAVKTDRLGDYYLYETRLEPAAHGCVDIQLAFMGECQLVLTTTEQGVVGAELSGGPEWQWRLHGSDEPWRTEPLVAAKAALPVQRKAVKQ